jgi:hypothetical protein
LDLEDEEEEMVVEPKETVTEDMKTDWGTPVASSPVTVFGYSTTRTYEST